MAKKMISVKLDEDVIELLKKLSEQQDRSQGGQIAYLVKKECESVGIKIDYDGK